MTEEIGSTEVLRRARNLIEDVGWCRDYLSIDADGEEVEPDDPDACAFCALGAVTKVLSDLGEDPAERMMSMRYHEALVKLDRASPGRLGIEEANDISESVDVVLGIFDTAIIDKYNIMKDDYDA